MKAGNKGAAFMLYLASVDKVAELAADPRAVLPAGDPAHKAWANEARVATKARELYKRRWEGR